MKRLPFVLMLLAIVLTPLVLRGFNNLVDATGKNHSFIPSFENRRTRKQFRTLPIEQLQYSRPGWIFIGDSMLGTRIHPQLLRELSERGDRNVLFLLHAASGPAYWYLSFKNHLVASGVKPRMTFFFFRDTNMTDTLFRLQSGLGESLDEVAHDIEPELDAIVAARERGGWARLDTILNRVYEVDTAAAWMQPSVRRWYALWKYRDPAQRLAFENVIEEEFNDNFRRDLAADLGAADDNVDFARDLPTSVLPLIVQLSKEHQLPVCFVRVQRRPVGNKPPVQSSSLVRYIADFRRWAESQGECFYDETGDPELTLDLYEDGDHVRDALAYTRIFRSRLDSLFR